MTSRRPRRSGLGFALLLPVIIACQLAGLYALRGLDVRSPDPELVAAAGRGLRWQLGGWLAAGLGWLALVGWLRRGGELGRGGLLAGVLGGLLLRLPALALPEPVHSSDLYRYLWDGAVQQAGHNPYLGPPGSPSYAALQAELPTLYARINHRELPTIYPPTAQLFFRAATAWALPKGDPRPEAVRLAGGLVRMRLLLGGCELLLCGVLFALLRRRSASAPSDRADERWLLLWLLCPLPAVEIWLNGHLDCVALLLLGLGLLAIRRSRRSVGAALAGSLLGLALWVKPLVLLLGPGLGHDRPWRQPLGRRRGLLLLGGVGAALLLLWLPYRQVGSRVSPSLGEYGRRWRSNDGAYALLQRGSEALVAVGYQPPYYEPWRSPTLARLVSGRDRNTVWPDELANFLARLLAAGLLLGLVGLALRCRLGLVPSTLLLFDGYALFTPTLHPWYLLWPLLFVPLLFATPDPAQTRPSRRLLGWPPLILVALSPLAYLSLPADWAGLGHHEALWPRLCEHGAAWVAIGWILHNDAMRRRETLPRAAPAG